ncbi:MAG: SAM-dependent DNA methyltransferase [Deltaproteobacteria bacterium]|nr:SAM-dependent DNA methyltransferase [Deltaproteobacteria bacterium]
MSQLVQKLWSLCHTLRHDGFDYGDYIEQITYLLFLKMASEKGVMLPSGRCWMTLIKVPEEQLIAYYEETLKELGEKSRLFGEIFSQATSAFRHSINLKKLIQLIDQENFSQKKEDVPGAAFEGLLAKAADEGKKGAGQYFTPRVLIHSIVEVMKPDPFEASKFSILDPACGTGGFLLGSYEWLLKNRDKNKLSPLQIKRLKNSVYYGQELVPRPRRLALMNLFLHGLKGNVVLGDSLYEYQGRRKYDCILTNPPFGTKGSHAAPDRQEFFLKTRNKQLNFIQHVCSLLKKGGRAAMVLPDNCLFERQANKLFRSLSEEIDFHTLLRLPQGTFTPYSPGVKANVLFFQKGSPTKVLWVYDARTGLPSCTKKARPLSEKNFEDFEKVYGSDPNGQSPRTVSKRFRPLSLLALLARDFNLDYTWLSEDLGVSNSLEGLLIEAFDRIEKINQGFEKLRPLVVQKNRAA